MQGQALILYPCLAVIHSWLICVSPNCQERNGYCWHFLLLCNVSYSKFVRNTVKYKLKLKRFLKYVSFYHWWEIPHLIFKIYIFFLSLHLFLGKPILYNWETVKHNSKSSFLSLLSYRIIIWVSSIDTYQVFSTSHSQYKWTPIH